MKLSTEQLAKVNELGGKLSETAVDNAVIRLMDADLIKQVTQDINAMPDREDLVAELKAKIDAGTYQATSDDIVVAMARRAIADRLQ
jgi:negative regulator of flagellin synthesis FlgM